MYCEKCKHELPADAQFCPHCGAKQESPQEYLCKHCGAKVSEGQVFCAICGVRIDGLQEVSKNSAPRGKKPGGDEDDEFIRIIEADEGFQAALAEREAEDEDVADADEDEEMSPTYKSSGNNLNILIGTLISLFGLMGTLYMQTSIENDDWWYDYEAPLSRHESNMLTMKNICIALIILGLIVIVVSFIRSKKDE